MRENSSVSRYIISLLISIGIGILTALGLLMLFTFLSLGANDPSALTRPLGVAALGISSIVCGMSAVLINRRSVFPPYLTGTLCGSALVLLLFTVSFVPIGTVSPANGTFRALSYGAVVLFSLLGSFLARPREKKHARSHMKRRYR